MARPSGNNMCDIGSAVGRRDSLNNICNPCGLTSLATTMISVVITTFASVAVAPLTLKLRSLLLREALVIAAAYVVAYAATRIPADMGDTICAHRLEVRY